MFANSVGQAAVEVYGQSMAPVRKWVPVSPQDVWAVLADPRAYAFWVVGSHDITEVEGHWPEPGSTFHHIQGQGPLKLRDTTTVVKCEPLRRLLLEVRIRPFLTGPVDIGLERLDGGTCITIDERAEGGLFGLLPGFVTSPPIAFRNADALRRLAGMAWARAELQPTPPPLAASAVVDDSGD